MNLNENPSIVEMSQSRSIVKKPKINDKELSMDSDEDKASYGSTKLICRICLGEEEEN
jgi:hypothetical protein